MRNFVGLGVDATFGFTQGQGRIHGCEEMSKANIEESEN